MCGREISIEASPYGRATPTASRLNSSLNFLRLNMTLLFDDDRSSWKCPR